MPLTEFCNLSTRARAHQWTTIPCNRPWLDARSVLLGHRSFRAASDTAPWPLFRETTTGDPEGACRAGRRTV